MKNFSVCALPRRRWSRASRRRSGEGQGSPTRRSQCSRPSACCAEDVCANAAVSKQRIPLMFFFIGAAFKALLVGLTWFGDFPSLVRLATIYDPAAFLAANI